MNLTIIQYMIFEQVIQFDRMILVDLWDAEGLMLWMRHFTSEQRQQKKVQKGTLRINV